MKLTQIILLIGVAAISAFGTVGAQGKSRILSFENSGTTR